MIRAKRTLTIAAIAALLVPAIMMQETGAEAAVASPPMTFGMDMGSIQAQTDAGIKPDYATFWVGPWTLKSGWGGPNASIDKAVAAGVTPMIHFYYWGDDISVSCVENGCWSTLHNAQKDRAGWDKLATGLASSINGHAKGKPVVIVLETEFNKGTIQTSEAFDGYLEAKAKYFHAKAPNAQVVLGFGNWNPTYWATFDRAAAASDYVGIQGMRGSTRNTLASYRDVVNATLSAVKRLDTTFGKPVFMTDLALSSYPEPEYAEHQATVLAAFFARIDEFQTAGLRAVVYRTWTNNPSMDTKNYFGEAERHWGLHRTTEPKAKPAAKVWIAGVKATRLGLGSERPWSLEADAFATKSSTGQPFPDRAATGGTGWKMFNNGAISHDVVVEEAGYYQFRIVARGDVMGGVAPLMELRVDGVKVTSRHVSSQTWITYSAASTLAAGTHNLAVAYTNDAPATSTGDRNLMLDHVSAVPVLRHEIEDFATKTAGGEQADSTASAGARWSLWKNGYVEHKISVPAQGTYELQIRAKGELYNGVAPHMDVSVDGVKKLGADPGTTWKQYETQVPLSAGTHTVRIAFTNNAYSETEDRNLLLDRVDAVLLPA